VIGPHLPHVLLADRNQLDKPVILRSVRFRTMFCIRRDPDLPFNVTNSGPGGLNKTTCVRELAQFG
jgi:hypothetical protein